MALLITFKASLRDVLVLLILPVLLSLVLTFVMADPVAYFYKGLGPYTQWVVLNFQNWTKVYAITLLMIIWSLLNACLILGAYVYTHILSGVRRFLLVSAASLPCSRLANFLFRLFDFTFINYTNHQLEVAQLEVAQLELAQLELARLELDEELISAAEYNMRVMAAHAARAEHRSQTAESDGPEVSSEYDGASSALIPSFLIS